MNKVNKETLITMIANTTKGILSRNSKKNFVKFSKLSSKRYSDIFKKFFRQTPRISGYQNSLESFAKNSSFRQRAVVIKKKFQRLTRKSLKEYVTAKTINAVRQSPGPRLSVSQRIVLYKMKQ